MDANFIHNEERRILLVGRFADSLASISRSLESFGPFDKVDHFDASETKIQIGKAKLIILEVEGGELLPTKALRFCSAVRLSFPSVPLIVVHRGSRSLIDDDESRAIEILVEFLFRGADDLIHWPFERAGFAAKIGSLLRRAAWQSGPRN